MDFKGPMMLLLDDYDSCKPKTKFMFNKLLEINGENSILGNGRIIKPICKL